MKNPIEKPSSEPLKKERSSHWHLRQRLVRMTLVALVFSSLAFGPQLFAVSPPPDGGYPHGNTAEGEDALFSLRKGSGNTAIGFNALFTNTNGLDNTAVGNEALLFNRLGTFNTASGFEALERNTTADDNTATGAQALQNTSTGHDNTATGFQALAVNTTGDFNTANGVEALLFNTTGNSNTALGNNALFNNTTGNNNVGVGDSAGFNLTTGGNNIDIGNAGVAAEANAIRIGTRGAQTATFIAGISGATVPDGVGVIVGTDGKLGTVVSAARYKDNIKPMDNVSEAILAFRPVTFRYKHELDPKGIPQFGLIAEEVAKVNPNLVARDEQGKPYTVRYEAVNAMLLNEFLKEHRRVQEQQKEIDSLRAELEEQKALIQKVNDKVELDRRAPRTVASSQ